MSRSRYLPGSSLWELLNSLHDLIQGHGRCLSASWQDKAEKVFQKNLQLLPHCKHRDHPEMLFLDLIEPIYSVYG